MFTENEEMVMSWLTGSNTCYLIGAGCSKCAEKPLIGELTENIRKNWGAENESDERFHKHFDRLTSSTSRPPTIEDLINSLVHYRDLLNSVKESEKDKEAKKDIDTWLIKIRKKIVKEIMDDWKPSGIHERFLERIGRNSWPGFRDIFTLNYDTIFEASLDSLRHPYIDGFRGTNRAWFDVKTYDEEKSETTYRIYKLHGSVNWTRDVKNYVRRNTSKACNKTKEEPALVYPSERKYLQTQFGIYEKLMGCFRTRLRENRTNNYLIVLGYSFNDEHINVAIQDAVVESKGNLTVYAFVGPVEDDKSVNEQRKCLDELKESCDNRFNAFVGNSDGFYVGDAFDKNQFQEILDLGLWDFEKLVDFIDGGKK